MEGTSSQSCRTRACVGVIHLTKDMRTGFIYRSRFFVILGWIQSTLGLVSLALCVFLYDDLYFTPRLHKSGSELSSSSSSIFLGILVAGIEILTGGVTLLTIQEPNYCWLHSAMACHFVHIIGQFILSLPTLSLVLAGPEEQETAPGRSEFLNETVGNDLWRQNVFTVLTVLSLVSVFIGSFLGSAMGYGVFCGLENKEKRKSSIDLSKLLTRRAVRGERKLVKLESFEPTNVAANLDEGGYSGYLPPYSPTSANEDDSIIFVNRHAEAVKTFN